MPQYMIDDAGRRVAIPAAFRAALTFTLSHEGGLANDRHDAGGLTRFGISQRTYPRENIKALTIERAAWLYFRDFWTAPRIDLLAQHAVVAAKVFDFGVNASSARAVVALQTALNGIRVGTRRAELEVDGRLGSKTAGAVAAEVRARGDRALLAQFCGLQWDHYERIARATATQRKFTPGWATRAMSLPPARA
jgi:lysozyme family protein